MLHAHALAVARGGTTLLHDVEASFAPGTFSAIVGANGVGKSSLLSTLCGGLRPKEGSVTLDGRDIATLDARSRARSISLVEPTEPVLAALTVRDAVAAARFPYHRWWEWQPSDADDAAVESALDATSLRALQGRELGTLSAGERQRVWIALALAQQARVIALDEPTTHLDLRHALETLALLRRLAADGAIVVAILHQLEEAAGFADRVLVLAEGRVIADGTPAETLTPATLARAFGVQLRVEQTNGVPVFHRKTETP